LAVKRSEKRLQGKRSVAGYLYTTLNSTSLSVRLPKKWSKSIRQLFRIRNTVQGRSIAWQARSPEEKTGMHREMEAYEYS
jgi:hypothetical protein